MKPLLNIAALAVAVAFSVTAYAQENPVQVLIIDETKTFTESIQVNVLVGLLKQNSQLEVSARLVDVATGLDLPFHTGELNERFDLVVLIPLDLGASRTIWLFGRPFYETKEPSAAQAALLVRGLLERVFALQQAVVKGTQDDLFPALLAGFFLKNGWL